MNINSKEIFVKRAREEWRTLMLIILSTNHMEEPDAS